MTTLLDETTGAPSRPEALPEATKAKPINAFAVIGALFLAFEIYLIARWILTGDADRTDPGPTPVPSWMTNLATTATILGLFALGAAVWFFIVKPWRREGHLTVDGMLAIICLLLYWHDPVGNYANHWSSYNAAILNLGSWAPGIPGWVAPRGEQYAEPILFVAPAYMYTIFSFVLIGNWIMRKAKARWPQVGTYRLIAICFVWMFTIDVLLECAFLQAKLYVFPGAIRSLSLFPGTAHQFPLYEAFLVGSVWTTIACLRYFKDDKGDTLVERGLNDLRVPARRKQWLRFLALFGFANLAWTCLYDIPVQAFAIHADDWPEEVTDKSYLLDDLCGGDTGYACPGPDIPVPRPASAHVDVDGTLQPPP